MPLTPEEADRDLRSGEAAPPTLMLSATLLHLGAALLLEARVSHFSPFQAVCYVTTEPEVGLVFSARNRRGRDQAGRVMVTSASVQREGVPAARAGLRYLLQRAVEQTLPAVSAAEPAPLLRVWSPRSPAASWPSAHVRGDPE